MAKVFIEETTLTAIGDAIREKTGGTDLIAPGDMPTQISGIVAGGGDGECNGLHVPEERLVFTGKCNYKFYQGAWDWFIEEFGDKITTDNITDLSYMFGGSNIATVPFALNCDSTNTDTEVRYFLYTSKLKEVPVINNCRPTSLNYAFAECDLLESFPENFAENWVWDKMEDTGSGYTGPMANIFQRSPRLRAIPKVLISHINNAAVYSQSLYYGGFNGCRSLEELELPVYTGTTWSSNAFYNTFGDCHRMKKLTFKVQADGTPYVSQWKTQTIDLTKNFGWSSSSGYITNYTNFTGATKVDDNLDNWKNYVNRENLGTCLYPDGWAFDVYWSTFSLTAACRLIETLPDTSAYLATAGGTNTIKFKGTAGYGVGTNAYDYNADSECINDMPEEIIALAAAKGWTVTLA